MRFWRTTAVGVERCIEQSVDGRINCGIDCGVGKDFLRISSQVGVGVTDGLDRVGWLESLEEFFDETACRVLSPGRRRDGCRNQQRQQQYE